MSDSPQTTAKQVLRMIATGRGGPWWAWPGFLLFLGLSTLAVSLVFYPGGDEWVYIAGMRFGEECGFTTVTGQPCPQCGMTRSWVHAARLQWVTSFFYNPAGFTLWLWLQLTGVVGAIRLIKKDENFFAIDSNYIAVGAFFWIGVIYLGPWLARIFLGINPLAIPVL